MNLEQRISKAKELTFVTIPNCETTVAGTWGSKGDFYHVGIVQPREIRTLTINQKHIRLDKFNVTCVQSGNLFGKDCNCESNSSHTLCYHSMGAMIFELGKRGQEIVFCKDREVAQGMIEHSEWDRGVNTFHFALVSSYRDQAGGSMWAVIRDEMKIVDHGNFQERINLMRGEEEEGID